jgi:MtN3 and saliva related transmembrane protein
VSRRTRIARIAGAIAAGGAAGIGGCRGLALHDAPSLLVPSLQRSEVLGLVAGFGTTFAALPDLIGMLKRRATGGNRPTMAAIMAVFQIVWVVYGLMIGSRPVVMWNAIAVVINSLSVGAYLVISRAERRRASRAPVP